MLIDTVLLTPLRRIPTEGGAVRHLVKASDEGFRGFGEAYLSEVEQGHVRGWKRHREMTLNLAVIRGAVRVIVVDDQADDDLQRREFLLDEAENYRRLTIPPGLWTGFQGVAAGLSTMINVADIPHDPTEADTLPIDHFPINWPSQ